MKTNHLFFAALALLAASCTNENLTQDTPEAKPLTLTVTLPEKAGADTRITYTRDVDNVYKSVWNDGDALSVVYEIGTNRYVDKFTLASKSADGRTATFSAPADTHLPATGTVTVGVYYPYREPDTNTGYRGLALFLMKNSGEVTTDNLEGMGNYSVFYATNITVVNQQMPRLNLSNPGTSFLRLPQGLRIFNNHTGTKSIFSEKLKANGFYLAIYKPTNFDIRNYDSGVEVYPSVEAEIKDGVLQRDVFIPILIKEDYTGTAQLELVIGENSYTWTLPSRTISAGKVYTVKQEKMPAKTL